MGVFGGSPYRSMILPSEEQRTPRKGASCSKHVDKMDIPR
jgi:hypothetical protein